jgi:glutathione S-transferase
LYPASGFLPTEAVTRAQVMQTLAWMNNTVHTTFAHIFLPHKFSDQKDVQAHLKQFNTQVYRELLAELQSLVEAAQSKGRTWLSGANFGPLDAYALTLTRWGGMSGIDPTSFGALWAHVQHVAAVPAVARVIERERLQLNVYQPA